MTPEEENAVYNELVSNFEIDECEEAEPNVVEINKTNYSFCVACETKLLFEKTSVLSNRIRV